MDSERILMKDIPFYDRKTFPFVRISLDALRRNNLKIQLDILY